MIEVDGRSVEYLRHESDGPALVLVHGAGGNAFVWEPLFRELSAFDIAAPSLPGRGASDGPAYEDAAEAAAWLGRWLHAVNDPSPIVIGHSYGGSIAIELALSGAAVAGLVLVCTGARLRVHPTVLEAAEQAVARGVPMSSRFAFSGASRDAIDMFEAAASKTPPAATLADWHGCHGFDRMGALGSIEVPVLVVGGAVDQLTPPKYHRSLADQLKRAQLEIVEGRGHMLPWEDPAGFASLVRSFAAAC